MKIAIIGYGKMGKTIEKYAIEQGHEILLRIDKTNLDDLNAENLKMVDVAIEFTSPHAAYENVKKCIEAATPVVSGSTGWGDQMEDLKVLALKNKVGFFHTSNFSIGVNIFREVNKYLAKIMNKYPMYQIAMKEIHHTEKLDAPSGTAVMLANEIIRALEEKKEWQNQRTEDSSIIGIESERIGDAKGEHIITYRSKIDEIEIRHKANSREGFALGAIAAAQFIIDKKGFYNMLDLMGLR